MGFLVSSRFQAAGSMTSFALCTAWGMLAVRFAIAGMALAFVM